MNALVIAALAAFTQVPLPPHLFLELRGGLSVGEVSAAQSGAHWHPGAAWSVDAGYDVHPNVAVYAGYGRSAFGCTTGLCQDDHVRFTSAGLRAGVRLRRERVWTRVGVVRSSLSSRREPDARDQPDIRYDGPAHTGVELGVGVFFDTGKFLFTPGVRYTLHDAAEGRVGVLAAEVGVQIGGRRR